MNWKSNGWIVRTGFASLAALVLLAASPASQAASGDVNQRLDRLETQVQEILRMLKSQQGGQGERQPGSPPPAPQSAPATTQVRPSVPAPAPSPTTTPTEPSAGMRPGGMMYYYIARTALDTPPPAGQARSKGVISDVHTLSFNPSDYDVPDSGFLSRFRDPSEYRSVAMLLDGEYRAVRGGNYRFVIYPKPARSNRDMTQASTTMSARLQIGEQTIVHFDHTTSWSERTADVRLAPGMHRFRLWVVDYSAGYGASPIHSSVQLAVKGPGDASAQPLTLYVSQ